MDHQLEKPIEKNERKYKIEQVPPEGGWGYLVCIGMAMPFVSITTDLKIIIQKLIYSFVFG